MCVKDTQGNVFQERRGCHGQHGKETGQYLSIIGYGGTPETVCLGKPYKCQPCDHGMDLAYKSKK